MKIIYMSALLLSMAGGAAFASTTIIQPINGKDAQIANESLADSNWGNFDLITNWNGNYRSIGLIEFDLSSIAPGSTVNSAILSLFHSSNSNSGSTYSIFRITSPWDENTVTFNTAPTIDATAVSSLTINDENQNQYRDWDVTALVSGWLNGSYANYGLWIEEVPIQGNATAYFESSDQRNPPKLIISSVPLPSAVWLFSTALFGLMGIKKRKA